MKTMLLHNNVKNKKVFNLVVFLACVFLYQFSYAKGNVIHGSAELDDMNFKSLVVDGSLKFSNLIIEEELLVNGSVNGKKLKCKKFKINGSFNGKDIEAKDGSVSGSLEGANINVLGETKIFGSMSVSDGNFGNIEINGKKSDLTNSKARSIFFKKEEAETQKLELNKKTIISGDVTFESGEGKIYLNSGSEIHGIRTASFSN